MLKLNTLKEKYIIKKITTLRSHDTVWRQRSTSRLQVCVCHVTRWSFPVGRLTGKAEERWQQTASRCGTCSQVDILSWWRGRKDTKEGKKVSGPNLKVWRFERHRSPRPRAPVWRVRCPPAVPVALDPPVLCDFSPFIAESCVEFPQKRLKTALKHGDGGRYSRVSALKVRELISRQAQSDIYHIYVIPKPVYWENTVIVVTEGDILIRCLRQREQLMVTTFSGLLLTLLLDWFIHWLITWCITYVLMSPTFKTRFYNSLKWYNSNFHRVHVL